MTSLTSISSANSLLSPKANGHASLDILNQAYGPSSASYQQTLTSAKLPNDALNLTPDELFTKHTVSEVKAVQQRLRADAEAKQEELRLMVGERYRDLLQASSSIISIAASSRRVLEAIEESKAAITSQHIQTTLPQTTTTDGLDDKHLLTLQVLSAHVKLLLDAPEHLWRLIERKKYLHAAWLFLLARVVHQALIRNDENDEQSWVSEGIDVLVEFPLVQRQWEVVSQFRSQIIHKSTLSLRESSSSTEDTCATLVTLHLLDSRPLNDALAALLLQRSKTLQSHLSWNPESGVGPSASLKKRGKEPQTLSVREVTQVMKNVLNTISQTVHTIRSIFEDGTSAPPIIIQVLRSIQGDSSEQYQLPENLRLSTQSLLAQLSSSANFQLLPSNLRNYAPYVDLDSASTSLSRPSYSQRLQEWFHKSTQQWKEAAETWLLGLHSVKDVWTLRNSIRRSITGSGFSDSEGALVHAILDLLCHKRIDGIWQKTLSDVETVCKTRLREGVASKGNKVSSDLYPVEYLFQPSPVPVLSQAGKAFAETPFQKYQSSLKRQLVGRTVQLENVISTLEQCARTIQSDFTHLKASGDGKSIVPLFEKLKETYQPNATSFSTKVASFIAETATEAVQDSAISTDGLAFLSRVTSDLVHSSSFIQNIGCTADSVQAFKESVDAVNQNVLQAWRKIVVTKILQEYNPCLQERTSHPPSGPSPQVFQALMSICENTRQLGVFHDPARQSSIAKDILRSVLESWIEDTRKNVGQNPYDISVLQKLANQHGQSWANISSILTERLNASVADDAGRSDIERIATDYLARTQTLLSILNPLPSIPAFDAPLLQFGVPQTGTAQHNTIDLAKPTPRFGMLLIGNQAR